MTNVMCIQAPALQRKAIEAAPLILLRFPRRRDRPVSLRSDAPAAREAGLKSHRSLDCRSPGPEAPARIGCRR